MIENYKNLAIEKSGLTNMCKKKKKSKLHYEYFGILMD